MQDYLTPAAALPADGTAGTLVGRAWLPGEVPGPGVVAIREERRVRSQPGRADDHGSPERGRPGGARAGGRRAHRRSRADPRQQRL